MLRVWVVVWVAAFALSCFSSLALLLLLLLLLAFLFPLPFSLFFSLIFGGGVPLFRLECRYLARQGKARQARKGGSKDRREDGW